MSNIKDYPVKAFEEALDELINYHWKDERIDFEETYSVQIESQDELMPWIEICEKNGWTSHIFYKMMLLKALRENE